jgi:hypothetical protein
LDLDNKTLMSNPILTEEEAKAAAEQGQQIVNEPSANSPNMPTPAQQAQQISNQNADMQGAVLPPQQAAEVSRSNPQDQTPTATEQQPQEAIQAVSVGAPQPQAQAAPQKSQAESIDQTIRGLLIQIIALQHNKEAQA